MLLKIKREVVLVGSAVKSGWILGQNRMNGDITWFAIPLCWVARTKPSFWGRKGSS